MNGTLRTEIESFIATWRESLLARDLPTAAALREPSYSAVLVDGRVLTREQELGYLSSTAFSLADMEIGKMWVKGSGRSATVAFDCRVDYRFIDATRSESLRYSIVLQKQGSKWQARKLRTVRLAGMSAAELNNPFRYGADTLRTAVRVASAARRTVRRVRTAIGGGAARKFGTSFQDVAYLAYKPGSDFSLPTSEVLHAPGVDRELPVPPQNLWLGYQYLEGKRDVDTMLEIVQASNCTFNEGDRILDLGCAAGRMIRHLQPLAATCEIWGTDISAEHIFWCKRNLQPPFHFATTTKVPHLPFEDRSFKLIYCGSVFTHIDDLADAWLLELHRLLAPDGRLYVTISDEHTLALFDQEPYRLMRYVAWIKRQKIYKTAYKETNGAFDMFTVSRDDQSQVYYNRDYFLRNAASMFEVLSVTPEAYSFQTAVLLKRK